MPRNMSFSMTTEAVRRHEKTVTRRLGWDFLKPGDLLWAVEKNQGFRKGEKVKRLALIRVLHIDVERLDTIVKRKEQDEVVKEGFPDWTPEEFVDFFCAANVCEYSTPVRRIEFEYVEAPDASQDWVAHDRR